MNTIRKYEPRDRENLRYVCRETAGEYFRQTTQMQDAVPIIYSDYFTDNEPDNIFVVADENDKAVGYIECSSDAKLFAKKIPVYMLRSVKMSKKMFPCCIGYFTAWKMNGRKNAVHLHIDILPDYQRGGNGTALINALRQHLKENGFDILGVNTIERSASAYNFYRKYGFTELRHYIGDIYSLTIKTGDK